MNRAEQIRARMEAIDAELAADPSPAGPDNAERFVTWLFESMPEEQRVALIEERRRLDREYNRLPDHVKCASDA